MVIFASCRLRWDFSTGYDHGTLLTRVLGLGSVNAYALILSVAVLTNFGEAESALAIHGHVADSQHRRLLQAPPGQELLTAPTAALTAANSNDVPEPGRIEFGGKAYNLTACVVQASNATGHIVADTVLSNGTWALALPMASAATVMAFTIQPANWSATTKVDTDAFGTVQAGQCYDAVTGYKQFVPMTALSIVGNHSLFITALTSLVAAGEETVLSTQDVALTLGLPINTSIGTYDAKAAAIANPDGPGITVLRNDLSILSLINLVSTLLYKPKEPAGLWRFASVTDQVEQAIVQQMKRSSVLEEQPRIDLKAATFIRAIMDATISQSMHIAASGINAISAAQLDVAATSIANLLSLILASRFPKEATMAYVVGQAHVAENVLGLGRGTLDISSFTSKTSSEALMAQLAATKLPAEPDTTPLLPAPSPLQSGRGQAPARHEELSSGGIAGTVLGTIAVVLMIGLVWVWLILRRSRVVHHSPLQMDNNKKDIAMKTFSIA